MKTKEFHQLFVKKIGLALLACLFVAGFHCTEDPYYSINLPGYLPFDLNRVDEGMPLTNEEIIAFTKSITGAWKNAEYFNWLDRMTYGLPKNNDYGEPYYSVLWAQTIPVKTGNTITFVHRDGHGADNITQIQIVILTNLIAAYYLTGDEYLAEVADELIRGMNAFFLGMVWDDQVPEENRHIMARYIVNKNFTEDLGNGRIRAVDYSNWQEETYSDGFSESVYVPNNPYWSDIYAKAKRSKDDVYFMLREAGILEHYQGIFSDPAHNEALSELMEHIKGFAKDIAENDYRIRTIDHEGNLYTPSGDFNSFSYFIESFGVDTECTGRLALDYLGYGSNYNNHQCNNGIAELFEPFSVVSNGYMSSMNRTIHMAGIVHALNHYDYASAKELLQGYIERTENEMDQTEIEPTSFPAPINLSWENCKTYNEEMAGELVKAAAIGLPLTSEEVRFIHEQYEKGIQVWNDWEWWDLWDENLPDGEYGRYYVHSYDYYPYSYIAFEDMTNFLQYCASPYINRDSATLVDCSIIADPSQWGE